MPVYYTSRGYFTALLPIRARCVLCSMVSNRGYYPLTVSGGWINSQAKVAIDSIPIDAFSCRVSNCPLAAPMLGKDKCQLFP